jgi:SAM-dependent methyltransferase
MTDLIIATRIAKTIARGAAMPPVSNAAMIDAWDGAEGDDWAGEAERYDRCVAHHHRQLFDAAAIRAKDRVLDVGCGNGESTVTAAMHASRGDAIGIDLSTRMLANASARAHRDRVTNVRFERADAQVHPFRPASFDCVISRFGLMFFDDPVEAFSNLRRALKPGGRLTTTAWASIDQNEWMSEIFDAFDPAQAVPRPGAGAPGPFGLADLDRTRRWLLRAGFRGIVMVRDEGPFHMGDDPRSAFDWITTIGLVRGLSHELTGTERSAAHDRLRASIAAHDTGDGVVFGSTALVVSAIA